MDQAQPKKRGDELSFFGSHDGTAPHTRRTQREGGQHRGREASRERREAWEEELEALIKEEIAQIETRMASLEERGQELKEAVEGLTVIQTEVRRQLETASGI